MNIPSNRRTITIFCWLCTLNIQINPVTLYEIKCSHAHNKLTLICIFNYLDDNKTLSADMPDDFRPYTKYITELTLGISNLTVLPNDTFKLMPNLNSLSVRADVQILTRKQFRNASKLAYLNFGYNNRITRLKKRLFRHAPALEYIDLGFNQISDIEDKAFKGLNSLKILILDANVINQIRNKTFIGMNNVERLELSRNQINEIETGSFCKMARLKILQLNYNRIARLQADIFSGLRSIERIDMSANIISSIDEGVFYNLTTLRTLEFGFNQLKTLPIDFVHGVPNLSALFISLNQFRDTQFGLANLTELTVIDLSYNSIFNIEPETLVGLGKLETLELRGCNLSELNQNTFANQKALLTLDLSDNNLTNIDWNVFTPMKQLRFLKLEANHIVEMENSTNIKSFIPNLEFINLSRNEIDCDTVMEMIEYFRNNTVEYEFGEEVDVGCRLLPLRSRNIQAFQLSNAKFNKEGQRLISFF